MAKYAWMGAVTATGDTNTPIAGTVGESKLADAFKIDLQGIEGVELEYSVHNRTIGWSDWMKEGEVAGYVQPDDKFSSGNILDWKQAEAIKIRVSKGLDKLKAAGYEIRYRVHLGYDGWEKEWSVADDSTVLINQRTTNSQTGKDANGNKVIAGSVGWSRRIEALQVMLVKTEKEPEVQEVKIDSFKVDSTGEITVKLNKELENARFLLNGVVVTAASSTDNTYTISGANAKNLLNKNKENVLTVTDKNGTFEETKNFVYRELIAPTGASVKAESGNAVNQVNSSNVKNVGFVVSFNGINTNPEGTTLVVSVKDSKGNVLELTSPLTPGILNPEVRGDLSSLEEGTLNLSTYVKDSDGNVSTVVPGTNATKYANAPVVTYESVTRASATQATVTNLTSTNTTDTKYYLVKGINESVPTVSEIIGTGKAGNTITNTATIPTTIGNDACIIYVASRTSSGTDSAGVLAIKVPKVGATAIAEPITLEKVAGTDATYRWIFDETAEEAEGFVEYRIILKNSQNKVVYEKVVKPGETKEINFFDILKTQELAGNYTAKVTAVADNEEYTNTDSNQVTVINMQPVITGINVTLDKEEKKITWAPVANNDVSNVSGYTVQVLKYDSTKESGKEYETVVASENVGSAEEYDFSSVVSKNGAGTYAFKVIANAKDTVLKLNKASVDTVTKASSTDSYQSIKYYEGTRTNNLSADIKDGKVEITGTLLNEDKLYDIVDGSKDGLVDYKLYYTTKDKSYAGTGTAIDSLPYDITGLNPGTEYKFMIVTEVDGNKYYSNETTVTTPITSLVINNATYVKPENNSPVLPTLTDGQITYKDGILYVGSAMTEYSSSIYPEVENIAAILAQMDNDDRISVNDTITALTLTDADNKATTYDLSKVPSTAKVEITGEANKITAVKGTLNEITLSTATKFDLSELSVGKVNVNTNAMDLTINTSSAVNVNFTTGTTATVNGVTLTQNTKLLPITVEGNKFTITGSANALTIDSSKVEKDIDVTFVGTNQNGLTITANAGNAVKVFTNSQEISGLVIKSGKVDVSNAVFTSLVVGNDSEENSNTVTLVTNSQNTGSTNIGEELTTDATLLDWLGYYLTASADDNATYSVNAGSKEIVFTLNNKATVTLNKKSESLKVEKDELISNAETAMSSDAHKTDYLQNMNAIQSVSVDTKTNTITVKVNNTMKKYTSTDNMGAGEHAYYSLLIDVGVPRDSLLTGTSNGQKYYQLTESDKSESEKWGATDTQVIVWLYADEKESKIDFVTNTGEHLYFTVIVEGYAE